MISQCKDCEHGKYNDLTRISDNPGCKLWYVVHWSILKTSARFCFLLSFYIFVGFFAGRVEDKFS